MHASCDHWLPWEGEETRAYLGALILRLLAKGGTVHVEYVK